MLQDLTRAFQSLSEWSVQRLLFQALLVCLLVVGCLMGLIRNLLVPVILQLGGDEGGFAASALSYVLWGISIGAGLMLIPVILQAGVAAIADPVAEIVEAEWFSDLPPAPPQPFRQILRQVLGSIGIMLGATLVMTPLMALWVGILLAPALGGWLIGRESFLAIARRRLPEDAAKAALMRHRGTVWFAGLVLWALCFVPIVQILVPVVAPAYMVAVIQRLQVFKPLHPGSAPAQSQPAAG